MLILHGHNDVVRKVTWEPSGSFLVCPVSLIGLRCPMTSISRLRVVQTGKSLYGTSVNRNPGRSNS